MAHSTTPSLGMQDYFTTTLTGNVNIGDTVINLAAVPTASEGFLVIDPNNPTTREVIYYSSKTLSTVTCPDATQGSSRGLGGTTVQAHNSGVAVEMRLVAEYWTALQNGQSWAAGSIGATAFSDGWAPGLGAPNTVVANGNRSYTLTYNGVDKTATLSPGMRLKLTRTVSAPTQCTSLNGTTQYWSKTSPAGMNLTDNITIMAWVKPTAYQLGYILSRINGAIDGWYFALNSNGQLVFGGARAADDQVQTYQSLPLNKWVHVAMTMNSAGTTGAIYLDGVLVPTAYTNNANSGFASPTASLGIGANPSGGGAPFAGKFAQVAIFNAVLSQATIQSYMSQGLAGTETSLVSAYSFNNSFNDLNANANNLTANGSATATATDSPFSVNSFGTATGTTDYGIVTSATFSTNTTLTVQVPEANTIPTSGGVSAVSYSTQKAPYGFPAQTGKWEISCIQKVAASQATPVALTWYNLGSAAIYIPIGEWVVTYQVSAYTLRGAAATTDNNVTLSTSTNTESDPEFTVWTYATSVTEVMNSANRTRPLSLTAAASRYLNVRTGQASASTIINQSATSPLILTVVPAHL